MQIKRIPVLGGVLLALLILPTLAASLSSAHGYYFKLASVTVYAAVTAALSVYLVALCLREKDAVESRATRVLFVFLAPLSLVHGAFFLFEGRGILLAVSVFVCVGCCFFLTAKYGKPLFLKIILFVISFFLLSPVFLLGFFGLIFGSIGQNTVVQSLSSPDGTYYAEVIDSNQGALGGDTIVNVYEQARFDAVLFQIQKNPQQVYWGEWGEFKTMEIYWKNENCLVINDREYKIE